MGIRATGAVAMIFCDPDGVVDAQGTNFFRSWCSSFPFFCLSYRAKEKRSAVAVLFIKGGLYLFGLLIGQPACHRFNDFGVSTMPPRTGGRRPPGNVLSSVLA